MDEEKQEVVDVEATDEEIAEAAGVEPVNQGTEGLS